MSQTTNETKDRTMGNYFVIQSKQNVETYIGRTNIEDTRRELVSFAFAYTWDTLENATRAAEDAGCTPDAFRVVDVAAYNATNGATGVHELDTMLRVFMVIEGSPEPVGFVHRRCRDNVPTQDDGFELEVDTPIFDEPSFGDCMYHEGM